MPAHFGTWLTHAREVRGLTLDALAAAAQVSSATISHAKHKPQCLWKPSVRHAVLRALHRRIAISEDELRGAVATGLIESEDIAKGVLRVVDPELRSLSEPSKIRTAFASFLRTCGSDEEQVFKDAGKLIALIGAGRARKILAAVVATMVASDEDTELRGAEQDRRLIFVEDVTFEQMLARIYTPITPPPKPAAATTHKRRLA